jgi:tetratricopeptide (TPR) repeat protein
MPTAVTHPAAAKTRNPVEKRMAQLHDLWWEETYHPHLRAIVLRAPGHSQRMVDAFFALQQGDSEYGTPDLFISFDHAFEAGFSYSRELRCSLLEIYEQNKAQFARQGITAPWGDAEQAGFDSAAGFMETGYSLARHLDNQVISAVLQPRRISDRKSFERWFDAAMQVPVPPDDAGLFRLVLLDDDDSRAWQPLIERHAVHIAVVQAPVNILDTAREVAAQSGGGGGAQVLYRQISMDMFTLLQHGDAAAVERKALGAMQLAVREGWTDQRSVIDMVVGSAWLKACDYPRSIERYRAARAAAFEAANAGSPAGSSLVVQTWMAEGGAWVASGDMRQAARTYEEAAKAAKEVPQAFFVIEGYRSAAQRWYTCGEREKAMEMALRGIQEARQMPDADRPTSTVPLLLNDLLRMHDPERCELIARSAADYEKKVLQAQTDADRAAHRLGPRPESQAIKTIEERLLRAYEQAFQSLLAAREQLITQGSQVFQTVVALGRQWLHPTWAGLPDVRHPLDLDIPEWSNPPEFAVLPDPQPMLETG